MKSITFIVAALLAVAEAAPDNAMYGRVGRRQAKGVQKPKELPKLNAQTNQGCYKSSGDMKLINGTVEYNSIGGCAKDICKPLGYAVAGSSMGAQCWCGNKYPAKTDLVDDKKCNVYCTGYDFDACGGEDTWSIYNTGKTLSVQYFGEPAKTDKDQDTASTTKSSSPAQTTVTLPGQTVTLAPDVEEAPKEGGKNVAGIVAGTVVGIIALAAALSGGYLFMRRKRNKEIEEEHRRNAAVNAFIGKPPGSSGGMSMTDSRMDPVLAHRRMSDGSIADNQDYSRRILRVTNA